MSVLANLVSRGWDWLPPSVCALLLGVTALLLLGATYLVFAVAFPKVAAIARTTAKEAFAQPLFWVELSLGAAMLLLFTVIPYNTFGEDIKMHKDSGLTLIMLLSIGLAVWTASVSIADELEGRTALTLLSKPIGRRQFVFGKFLGVLVPAFVMFVLLSTLYLETVDYKLSYDARETANSAPTNEQLKFEILMSLPPLILAFLETTVLASIAIAISTRWPMLPNLMTCFAIYVLGHLTPLIVQSSIGQFKLVTFVGRLLATLLPMLDAFKSDAAIAADRVIPLQYLGAATAYTLLYGTIAMLLALLLFEDRDLA
ncbi:MAG TPA: hypothetical protein VHB99_13075 [Pirellulales bacterium]|nr:hypothetical protein [Pirellulales bacterium]